MRSNRISSKSRLLWIPWSPTSVMNLRRGQRLLKQLPRLRLTWPLSLGLLVLAFELKSGKKLKGNNPRAISFQNFSHFRNFSPRAFPFKTKGFAQWEQKRRKDNKKNRTNRCCMLVVARLFSSSSSSIGPLPGNKSAFALLDGPLPDKEVIVVSKASEALTPFAWRKSLLVVNPDGGDSDSATQPLPRNTWRHRAPFRSCLASKSRGRELTRPRSHASPERRLEDGRVKPSGFVPGHAAGRPLPPMPEDLESPTIHADFLSVGLPWASSAMGSRIVDVGAICAFASICTLHPGSWKHSASHPRSFAACVLSSDESLEDACCCWACYVPTAGKEDCLAFFDSFLYQWCLKHARDIHYRWSTIALELETSRAELASTHLGVNLDTCALPCASLGLQAVPRSLPPRADGHNKLVFGPPWNVTIRGHFSGPKQPHHKPQRSKIQRINGGKKYVKKHLFL